MPPCNHRCGELFDADGAPLRENATRLKYPPIAPTNWPIWPYAEHDLRNGIRRMRQETRDKALVKVLQGNWRDGGGRDRPSRRVPIRVPIPQAVSV